MADGGSTDDTVAQCQGLVDSVVQCRAGRAIQMNAGAGVARHDALWFLHADTLVPAAAADLIIDALDADTDVVPAWGRFNVRFSNTATVFSLIAWCMNKRSCMTGIATGDQAIFVRKSLFQQLGGFPEIDLMEDIALSRLLRRFAPPVCLSATVTTSSRRWERHGVLRTVLLMWKLRLLYFFGVSPRRLALMYRGGPAPVVRHRL